MEGLNKFKLDEGKAYLIAHDSDDNEFLVKEFPSEREAENTAFDPMGEPAGEYREIQNLGYWLSVEKKKPKKHITDVEKSLRESLELNESKESKDAIKLFQNFDKAFKDLVAAMEDDSDDLFVDNVGDDYPFEDSLDDLYHIKVKEWINSSIGNLKKVK